MLLIETSTERSGLALFNYNELIFEVLFPQGLQSSQHLLPTLQNKLQEYAFSLQELKVIGVGIGPGSYTGIRVGAVTAKSLSYALKKPLVGLTTLKWFTPVEDGLFNVVIDAKIGGIYCIKGKKVGENVHYLSDPVLCPWEEVAKTLDSGARIVSPNLKTLREKILLNWGKQPIGWEEVNLDFAHVAREMQKAPLPQAEENARLELLYLRETQAEIEKKQKLKEGK